MVGFLAAGIAARSNSSVTTPSMRSQWTMSPVSVSTANRPQRGGRALAVQPLLQSEAAKSPGFPQLRRTDDGVAPKERESSQEAGTERHRLEAAGRRSEGTDLAGAGVEQE